MAHLEINKSQIISDLELRRGVSNTPLLNSLYDDAIIDICNFCNRKQDELVTLMIPAIKDLIMFRYNTIGGEGIISESLTGSSIQYEQDIPSRIKTILRKFRRLPQ